MIRSQDMAAKPLTLKASAPTEDISPHIPVYPNQYQAWGVVAGLAITLCILFGTTLNSFGVFTLPIMHTFQSTNEQTANIATAFMFAMTLAMPIAGWLLDRIGPRTVMTTGAVLMSAGYLLASVSENISNITLALALAGAGVGASTYVPAIALVMRWVELKRQGIALGITLSGATIGTIIFPMLLTRLTEIYDWRYTMQIIAALSLFICVPILLWLARLPNQSMTSTVKTPELPGASILKALSLPRYWFWVALKILMTLSSLGILVNIIPYLVSIGYTAHEAAIIHALTSVAGLASAFIFGMLSSRWDIKSILMVTTALGALGILALLLAKDPTFGYSAILAFIIAWGATFNLVNQLSPMLMALTVGQRNFGTLLGIGSLIAGLGAAFSPKLIGYLIDTSGSYSIALLLCTACTALALLPIALQPKRTPVVLPAGEQPQTEVAYEAGSVPIN